MSIFIAPRDPSGWQWLVQCWRRWRNRKRGGIPKGYRDMGMVAHYEVHTPAGEKPKAYVSPSVYAQLTPEYLYLYDVHVILDDPPTDD